MKRFNCFFLVFALLFFAACSDGAERIVPETEKEGESGEKNNKDDEFSIIDDDASDSSADPSDSGSHADDSDSGGSSDEDTADSSNDDPADTETELTPEQKCKKAGGTWSADAEDSQKCRKTATCEKPEYAEWRDENNITFTQYYNFETEKWEGGVEPAYATEGEPQPCQYVCTGNAGFDEGAGRCKPYCSAVFDGSSSRIEVAHNDVLNLGDTWTIEGWVNQDMDNLISSNTPPAIIRKGGQYSVSYFLTAITKNSNYNTMEGGFYYSGNTRSFTTKVGNSNASTFDNALKDGWNHIALSYFITADEAPLVGTMYTAHIRIYVNGKIVSEQLEDNLVTTRVPNKLSDPLIIGYDAYHQKYFNGKIDQLKISTNTYEGEFTPSKLSVDDNTIAFWDFNNDTNDASGNALNCIGTNILYSTDCME